MDNFINNIFGALQATPLIQSLQRTQPIQNIQNTISNWAAQNPNQAGNILNATGGSFGSLLTRSPNQVVSSLVGPTIARAITPITPTQVRAAPIQVQQPKVITPVQPRQSFATIVQQKPQARAQATGPIIQNKPMTTQAPTQTVQQQLDAAKASVAPYYQRLLEESNWNIDTAKKKLEDDYQLGKRGAEQSSDEQTKQLFQQTIPEEQQATAENLNRRGLLTTVQGAATPITGTLSTGEQITPTNPTLTRSYGGIAGNQIGKMQTSQQARAEAIGRALSQKEAELQLPYQQGMTEQTHQQGVNQWQIGQAENTAAANQLAEQQKNQAAKTGAILGSLYSF